MKLEWNWNKTILFQFYFRCNHCIRVVRTAWRHLYKIRVAHSSDITICLSSRISPRPLRKHRPYQRKRSRSASIGAYRLVRKHQLVPLPFWRTASLPVRLNVCDQLLEALVTDGDGCDDTDDVTSGSGSAVETATYCFRFRCELLVAPPVGRHRQ